MFAYKLFNVRKDGTLGPLFINRRQHIPIGYWLPAEHHPTKGYKDRIGWHACSTPDAPHLSTKGRRWYKVWLSGEEVLDRPPSQGGEWFISPWMMVLEEA